MREKGHIRIFHPIRQTLSFQHINDGKCTLIVPVQYRRLLFTVLRNFQQIVILSLSGHCPDLRDTATGCSGCGHGLRMAVPVFLYQLIRCPDDLLSATVIRLHKQQLCPGMSAFEFHQCPGICRPEPVNTLIFIPHHEQISAFCRQQIHHIMLYLRSVLCLIHTEILIFLPEIRKHLRILFENPQSIDHLIIIIYHLHLSEFRIIRPENLRELFHFRIHIADLFRCQTHIFRVSDLQLCFFDIVFRSILSGHFPKGLLNRGGSFFICHLKWCLLRPVCKILQYFLRNSVNRTEFQSLCIFLPEYFGKSSAHILGGRHSISYGQNGFRPDPQTIDHISQSADQHGSLTAAGYRKQ